MGLLKNIEQAAAKKLMRIFMDAKKYADTAVDDITRAEKELEAVKARAAEATKRHHEAAVEAAQKAREVAEHLAVEAMAAEQRAKEHSRG
jgi:phage gp46-like protein